jgi:hypothetical protein
LRHPARGQAGVLGAVSPGSLPRPARLALSVQAVRGPDAGEEELTDKFEKAKLYYSLATREAILSLGDDFYDSEDAHSSILEEHPEIKRLPSRLLKSEVLFKLCLRDLIRAGWIDCIEDEFAPLFIRGNASLDDGPIADINFRRLHDKYEKLGDSQFEWLNSALIGVVDSFEIEELNAILEKGESEFATKAKPVEPPKCGGLLVAYSSRQGRHKPDCRSQSS